jgi:hypothetical protein
VLVVNGDRDPFGVPEPDATTQIVVIDGETHALAKHPEAIGAAVAQWLAELPGLLLSACYYPPRSGGWCLMIRGAVRRDRRTVR